MTELAAWFFAIAVLMALAGLTGLAGVASGIAQILSAAFALFCLLALLFRGPAAGRRPPRAIRQGHPRVSETNATNL
ncbi:hypothetical protein [Thioalkalivibrio sulfidiphilus]|uniref:hypothetical protein n=1 Tax=Thioalkalivibrio sulfidiphilus TaxID=1033854 RepID=UPI003B319749